MKLTGRVRHRAVTGINGRIYLVLQVERECDKSTSEDLRKGLNTKEWVDAQVEHLSEIDIKGELK